MIRSRRYLDEAKEDILTHLDDFKPSEEQPSPLPFLKMPKQEASFAPFHGQRHR